MGGGRGCYDSRLVYWREPSFNGWLACHCLWEVRAHSSARSFLSLHWSSGTFGLHLFPSICGSSVICMPQHFPEVATWCRVARTRERPNQGLHVEDQKCYPSEESAFRAPSSVSLVTRGAFESRTGSEGESFEMGRTLPRPSSHPSSVVPNSTYGKVAPSMSL